MTDNELIEVAKKYRENAYVPYSKFKVGCCNVENASYPAGLCAERTAIFKAVSEGEQNLVAIAVVADTEDPCSPCGICRQVMAEFKIPKIIMTNLKGNTKIVTLEEILPFAFSDKDL